MENGVIVPNSGVDAEFDKSTDDVENCERELESYLESQKSKLRCSVSQYSSWIYVITWLYFKSIKYFGTGKNSYQMEIPDAVCAKISSDYSLLSQRKVLFNFLWILFKNSILVIKSDKKIQDVVDINLLSYVLKCWRLTLIKFRALNVFQRRSWMI